MCVHERAQEKRARSCHERARCDVRVRGGGQLWHDKEMAVTRWSAGGMQTTRASGTGALASLAGKRFGNVCVSAVERVCVSAVRCASPFARRHHACGRWLTCAKCWQAGGAVPRAPRW